MFSSPCSASEAKQSALRYWMILRDSGSLYCAVYALAELRHKETKTTIQTKLFISVYSMIYSALLSLCADCPMQMKSGPAAQELSSELCKRIGSNKCGF